VAVEAAAAVGQVAGGYVDGQEGELRLGLSPGAHYVSQALLAEFARRRPRVRVRAREESSGTLARNLARGELEVALGFCSDPPAGVVSEPLVEEPVVVAVAADHPLAGRETVALSDLAGERFALVDPGEGPGYNRAVADICRAAGFEAQTASDPRGPMAWESAVRTAGCVGLTTRSATVSTARGVRLLELHPPATFQLELLLTATPEQGRSPAVRAFIATARELAAGGVLA
jgi:DNA-binding transcriptional LysR family regulator